MMKLMMAYTANGEARKAGAAMNLNEMVAFALAEDVTTMPMADHATAAVRA
jgi:hypothetical protein